uniref:NADH-ubiquinone oxidoreductase chain 4L n=1 Tax=Trigonopteryx hopei TaxID=62799 RepID=M4JDH9_9ORTH|nr:NADH dehydrogenase subunit 4L [Trigonopteryx hopei]
MVLFNLIFPFFMYFVGLYVFSFKCNYLLMVLLSLEYMVLSLFLLIVIYLIYYNCDYFFVVMFLVYSVCEGALGLSILVSMVRFHGNDYLNSFGLLLC